VWFSSQSLSESASIFLVLTTCFFCGIMANFYVNVYISSRENSCKIGRAPYGVWLIFYNAVRCLVGHRPMFLYTDTERCPYDMWPRKRKFLKIIRCPGDYQIRRWCAHRWNRTMSVLFVTIAFQMFVTLQVIIIKVLHLWFVACYIAYIGLIGQTQQSIIYECTLKGLLMGDSISRLT